MRTDKTHSSEHLGRTAPCLYIHKLWRRRLRPFWDKYHWPFVMVLALVVVVLGCIGFGKCAARSSDKRSFLDLLYLTLQLFVFQSGYVPGPVPLELQFARFLAPAVVGYTAISALAAIFREQIQLVRLRLICNHAVVCGAGRKGLQLVKDLRGGGHKVVVIEADEDSDDIVTCRDLRAIVIVGNAARSAVLASAGVERARYLIAVCGDDNTNVEIAVRARELAQKRKTALRCFVHVLDITLCALFKKHKVFTETKDKFEVSVFNVYENAARLLLNEHPLDREGLPADDPRSVHLVVVGFGKMGQTVALQAGKTGQYANGKEVRLTVVDRDATRKMRLFCERYQQFNQVCNVSLLEEDAENADFLQRLPEEGGHGNSITTVVICLDSDSRSFSCAVSLLDKTEGRRLPVMVRMSKSGGLASLLGGQDCGVGSRMCCFGMIERTCTLELLLNREMDRLARVMHAHYRKERMEEGVRPGTDPALLEWHELDESYRESNRQQADHIPVKLRAIGCYSSCDEKGGLPVTEFTREEIELLAKMEHSRFVAERLLAGWTSGLERNLERKISPYLIEWDQLPENIKDYDRQSVSNIPNLLASIGERIYRRSDAAKGQLP